MRTSGCPLLISTVTVQAAMPSMNRFSAASIRTTSKRDWSQAKRTASVMLSASCSCFGVRGYALGCACFFLANPSRASILGLIRLDTTTGCLRCRSVSNSSSVYCLPS